MVRNQWEVCVTGSGTAGGLGHCRDWGTRPTAGETVGFGKGASGRQVIQEQLQDRLSPLTKQIHIVRIYT